MAMCNLVFFEHREHLEHWMNVFLHFFYLLCFEGKIEKENSFKAQTYHLQVARRRQKNWMKKIIRESESNKQGKMNERTLKLQNKILLTIPFSIHIENIEIKRKDKFFWHLKKKKLKKISGTANEEEIRWEKFFVCLLLFDVFECFSRREKIKCHHCSGKIVKRKKKKKDIFRFVFFHFEFSLS